MTQYTLKDKRHRNITRYTYTDYAFLGWRVATRRRQNQYQRYFSEREFGGEEASFAAALLVRDLLMQLLERYPDTPTVAFEQCSPENLSNARIKEMLAARANTPEVSNPSEP